MASPLLVSERSGTVAAYTRAEGQWARRLVASGGRWPAANPQGTLVALGVIETSARSVSSRVDLVDLVTGAPAGEAYQSPPGVTGVIAPRIPSYVLWSPLGDFLGIVAQGDGGLTLSVSSADGLFSADRVITGAPIFFAWGSDNRTVCAHTGEEVALLDVRREREPIVLARPGGGFRTPAFSLDGRYVAFARPEAPGAEVVTRDLTTGEETPAGRFDGGVALAYPGGGPLLSVAVNREPDAGMFHELWLVAPGAGHRAVHVARGPFAACFWSPAGDRVALLVPLQSGDGRYAVQVRDQRGNFVAATEGFVPSQDYRTVVGFFDQYALSHHLWSPGGEEFTVAGRLAGDGLAASFADQPLDYVMSWRVGRSSPFEIVAPGDTGFYAAGPQDR